MLLSYYKYFDDKCLEVIVECPDDGSKTGTVIDAISHPPDYKIPEDREIVYQKGDEK